MSVPNMPIMKNHLILSMLICLAISHHVAGQTEIGLQLYSLRNQFKTDVPGTLKQVQQWGIREIEGGGTYGLPMDDFKKLLAQNNLKMVSVSADFEQLRNKPESAIEHARAFGASYVVCYWIPHENDEFTIDHVKDAIEVFNKAGKLLAENGISLCYHPHGFEFRPYEDGTLFDYLVRNTDPRYFNFEMDVFWVKHPGQDPAALLRKYPDRFPLMHLKDRRPGTPGNHFGRADVESNVVLGTGDVGIAEVMREAKKAGVKHYFVEDESSRCLTQIPRSLAYLKKLEKKK